MKRIFAVLTALAVFAASCDNPSGGEKARYGISLSVTGTHTFTAAAEGYAAITPLTVTVTNTGNRPTGRLTVTLSGTGAASFTLDPSGDIEGIPAEGNRTFRVGPNTGLGEGSYAAEVTVSGDNGIAPKSFGVSFTVMEPLNSIAGVSSYLSAVSGGSSADAPVLLPVNINLADTGGNGWAALLSAIQSAGRYVALDLSASTGVTTFDPGADDTGERYVVSLVLPDGAAGVKASASNNPTFRYFTALKSVAGAGVTSVGDWAFYGCYGLTTARFPKATSIGEYAFHTIGLTSVSLPLAESIREGAFFGCTGLTTADFPKATSIGDWAFAFCTALTTADFPKAASIGYSAFADCTGLGSVSLPAGLTTIGDGAFRGCTALTDITVDSGNPSYKAENGMLLSKDGKTLIAYPSAAGALTLDGITSVGDWAFYGCTGLTSMSLPEAESVGDYAFYGSSGLTSVSLPKATSIGKYAFWNCTGLTSVSLLKATAIGVGAFEGCTSLTTVSLPEATSIGDYAFASTGGTALTVTLGNTVPELGEWMFSHVTSTKAVTVRVPSGASDWSGIIGGSPYTETGSYTVNWGNGFRGGGWVNNAVTNSSAVNSNITLTVTTY